MPVYSPSVAYIVGGKFTSFFILEEKFHIIIILPKFLSAFSNSSAPYTEITGWRKEPVISNHLF